MNRNYYTKLRTQRSFVLQFTRHHTTPLYGEHVTRTRFLQVHYSQENHDLVMRDRGPCPYKPWVQGGFTEVTAQPRTVRYGAGPTIPASCPCSWLRLSVRTMVAYHLPLPRAAFSLYFTGTFCSLACRYPSPRPTLPLECVAAELAGGTDARHRCTLIARPFQRLLAAAVRVLCA